MEAPLTVGRASATIAEVTASSSARSTRSPSLQASQQEMPIRQRKAGRGSSKLQIESIIISSSSNEDDAVQPPLPARRQARQRANVVKSDSSDDDIPAERETKMRKLTHPSENEDDRAAFESVLQAVKDTYVKVSSARGPTYSKLVNTMYNDYTFLRYIPGPQTLQVEEVLSSNAQGLIDKLGRRDYAAIYPKLTAFVAEPLQPKTLKDTPFVARPRKRYAPSFTRIKSRSSSVQSEVRTPQRAGKGLKTPGRSRSALRPIKTITKGSQAKEIDNTTNPSSSDDSDDDMVNASAAMSDLQASPCPPGQRAPALVVDAELMPSTEAKGLDNTWMCSIEGCDHVVRGGTKYNCKMRIQDHLQGHTEGSDNDALVDLAVTEAAGNMSIKYDFPPPTPPLSSPLPQEAAQSCASTGGDTVSPESAPETAPVSSPNVAFLSPAEVLRSDFSRLVNTFWRNARPVSDKIDSLTLMQQPPREDSQHGRWD